MPDGKEQPFEDSRIRDERGLTDSVEEYPETDINGVAYVIDVSHITEDQVKVMCENVQYCHKKQNSGKSCYSSILNNESLSRPSKEKDANSFFLAV
ncbi:hypothetical protein V496_00693 [Pseudogymnoascus sp. VKM F-4515 (FW-2607)]|nr:hypothetical protein V496_00693 [Pseudogymnoascus sp. VKM F-4515 (FW-2607)]